MSHNDKIENYASFGLFVCRNSSAKSTIVLNPTTKFLLYPSNPVPGLDRDTHLSPGSVYGEKSLDFGTVF